MTSEELPFGFDGPLSMVNGSACTTSRPAPGRSCLCYTISGVLVCMASTNRQVAAAGFRGRPDLRGYNLGQTARLHAYRVEVYGK